MIVNTYKTYLATHMDGSTLTARKHDLGFFWIKNHCVCSPVMPEEHLGKWGEIVNGSFKNAWATESIYVVEDYDCQTTQSS